MKITVLGTATPYPRPGNACSGYLLQHDSTAIWVDAGTGTLAELQRHIGLDQLTAIWISHSHADHTADLLTAYYALRFADVRPGHPVPLYCPPGLRERLVGFLGPSSVKGLPRAFDFIEHDGWGEATINGLNLSWGPVDHGMPAYALRVQSPDLTVAYSGDSAYCQSLVELAEDADLLLCEADYSERPDDGPAVHCTPEDASRIAREARVPRLVLTHLGLDSSEAKARAATDYEGAVQIAEPGQVVVGR
jgi:ribonuclease BN (tRNA processing enzyme)